MGFIRTLGVLVFLALSAAPIQAQQSPAVLPGGASSLTETHGDWTIRCQMVAEKDTTRRVCVMTQTQVNPQGQQVMSVELGSSPDGLEGTIVLPFGLAVTKPIALSIDEGQSFPATFSTCVPAGCLAPIAMHGDLLAALRSGSAMTVAASTADNQTVKLPIPLKGFSAAETRLAELTR